MLKVLQGKFALVLALHFYLKYLMHQGLHPAGTSYFTRSTEKMAVSIFLKDTAPLWGAEPRKVHKREGRQKPFSPGFAHVPCSCGEVIKRVGSVNPLTPGIHFLSNQIPLWITVKEQTHKTKSKNRVSASLGASDRWLSTTLHWRSIWLPISECTRRCLPASGEILMCTTGGVKP